MPSHIVFNNEGFHTKKAVLAHITGIVNNIFIGEEIGETHRHFGLFMELLNRHEFQMVAHTKGVSYFVFVIGGKWGEKQLNAICRDGNAYIMIYNWAKLTEAKIPYGPLYKPHHISSPFLL